MVGSGDQALPWQAASAGRSDADVARGGVHPLPVTLDHATAVEALPWHHRDPFDRMLVAQALAEGAAIVSGDDRLKSYDVTLLW